MYHPLSTLVLRILHFDECGNDSIILNHDQQKEEFKRGINYQSVVCTLLRIRSYLSTSFALHSTGTLLMIRPSNDGLNHKPRPKGGYKKEGIQK